MKKPAHKPRTNPSVGAPPNPATTGPVTIIDVARRCGVSIRTVSKVLNDEEKVSAETRLRVQGAIRALNYKPNFSARNLAGRRAYLVALLYDDPAADYLVELIQGAQRACHRLGYGLLPEPMRLESPRLIDDVQALIRERRPSGVVITPPICDLQAVIDAMDAGDTPFTCISRHGPLRRGSVVRIDDLAAAFDVTQHLLSLGHRRIGFIKGPAAHASARLRLDGFLKAHASAGVSADTSLIRQGNFSFESGRECAADLLGRADRPTAIFASNDKMAAGALHAAYDRQLSVPRDVSLVGFDDSPLSRHLWPGLTTVRQPVADMSEQATELVIQASRQKAPEDSAEPRVINLPYDVILRSSSGPVPASMSR